MKRMKISPTDRELLAWSCRTSAIHFRHWGKTADSYKVAARLDRLAERFERSVGFDQAEARQFTDEIRERARRIDGGQR
jgi:hypothetical protein